MSDAFSAERLAQLEERWRREPESRVFLQLAEEYRRGGMMSRAVEALEQGVARHPNQVSALVALGRCRLEVDDATRAVEAFELALTLDPAQLVANRLLVEAYLRTQQPAKARERLAFYRLFNDSDAEIDALERRIAAATPVAVRAPAAARGGAVFELGRHGAAPAIALAPPRRGAGRAAEPFGRLHRDLAQARGRIVAALAGGGVFPVAVASPPPTFEAHEAIETFAEPATLPVFEPAPEPVFAEPEVAAAAAELIAPPLEAPRPPWGAAPGPAELLFEAREQIVETPFSPRTIGAEVERELIEEPFDEVSEAGASGPGVPPPVTSPRPPEFSAAAWAAPSEPEPATVDFAALASALAPAPEAAPEPAPATAEAGPTTTLGELYLRQGYLDDAETEFRRVLEGRPGDPGARAGLTEIARRRAVEETAIGWRGTATAPASTPSAAAPAAPAGGLTQRKIGMLRDYLERLRRGREQARVS